MKKYGIGEYANSVIYDSNGDMIVDGDKHNDDDDETQDKIGISSNALFSESVCTPSLCFVCLFCLLLYILYFIFCLFVCHLLLVTCFYCFYCFIFLFYFGFVLLFLLVCSEFKRIKMDINCSIRNDYCIINTCNTIKLLSR